jgi:dienelactone hydrolase
MRAIIFLFLLLLAQAINAQVEKRNYQRPPEEGKKHLDELLALYPDSEKWQARKEILKNCILEELGLCNLNLPPDLAAIGGYKRIYGDYSVENTAIEVIEGVWLSTCIYKPYPLSGKLPVVLCPHGHFSDKDTNLYGRYRPDMQYRCAMLAKMGAVAISYDMFDWGESRLQFGGKLHKTDVALPVQSLYARRLIDYFSSLKYVDNKRIAITGASGGGTQSFLAAALDERVSLCVPVVMVSSYFDGGCACESGLPIHMCTSHQTNNAEIAAMIAPRPLLVISDGDDWTKNNPEIEVPYLKKVYTLTGAPENFENVHLANEKHDYGYSKRIAMYDFVSENFKLENKELRAANGKYDESGVVIEPYTKMLVFKTIESYPGKILTTYGEVKRTLEDLRKK